MNSPAKLSERSWVDLLNEPMAVRGPCRSGLPNLSDFRVELIHISDTTVCVYGAFREMPPGVEPSWISEGRTKLEVAIQMSAPFEAELNGLPQSDPEADPMHGFPLALPVHLRIEESSRETYPGSGRKCVVVAGDAPHLKFRFVSDIVYMFLGKRAREQVRYFIPANVRSYL